MINISQHSIFHPERGGTAIITSDGKDYTIPCPPADVLDFKVNFRFLNPLQTAFLKLWDKSNVLVASATSSGKSLLIHIFMKDKLGTELGCRAIYLAPTKSLVREKLKEFGGIWGWKNIGIRTGDSAELTPPKEPIILSTYESCLAAARVKAPWFEETHIICFDEIHFLAHGGERGIFLEELLSYTITEGKSIIALSATVEEPERIAEAIQAQTFVSIWRPVPLERRIEGTLGDVEKKLKIHPAGNLVERMAKVNLELAKSEKILIFVHKKTLGWGILETLDRDGVEPENETLPFEKTTYGSGVKAAFHNADIPVEERERIEEEFRKPNSPLRYLIATSSMAFGVNLPADEALIFCRKVREKIYPDPSTILQMEGRVGRLGFSQKGISHIIALSGKEAVPQALKKFFESPFKTSLEKLANGEEEVKIEEDEIQTLIVLGFATRYGHSFGKAIKNLVSDVRIDVERALWILERTGCIKGGIVTPLGKALSASLISPISYEMMKEAKKTIKSEKGCIPPDEVAMAFILRPLMRRTRIDDDSFLSLLREDLKTKLVSEIMDFIFDDDGTTFLYMWMSGKVFKYFSNPPSQFMLRSEVMATARFFASLYHVELEKDIDPALLHDTLLSMLYGVPIKHSRICSIEGIGFVRGNAISQAIGNASPEDAVGGNAEKIRNKIFDVLKAKQMILNSSLFSEYAEQRTRLRNERDEKLRKISDEVGRIVNILKSATLPLVDLEIARILLFPKFKLKVMGMSRETLSEILFSNVSIH